LLCSKGSEFTVLRKKKANKLTPETIHVSYYAVDNPEIQFNPLVKLYGFCLLNLKLFFQIELFWFFVLASKTIACV